MAKHLARLGWDVTVVTPNPSIWRNVDNVHETETSLEREGIRRILTGHRWRCLTPNLLRCRNRGLGWLAGGICRKVARRLGIDLGIGWMKEAERACARLTSNDVDVVLASGPPFMAFSLARRVADRLGRPYVLDYRDPWTGFPHAHRPARPATIGKEASLLAGCAAVTIVSDSWAVALDRRFGVAPKLHVVTNGYDPSELSRVEPYAFGHFAIVYAGSFYLPKRAISPVMAALKMLDEGMHNSHAEWYFHYYGPHEQHVGEEAQRFGVVHRTILHGMVPRSEALSALRGAGVAVVITSIFEKASLEDEGIVTGKVFETMGLQTPILLVAPDGSDARLVVKNASVGQAFTGGETAGIASFLKDLMLNRIHAPVKVSTYSWENIAKGLDAILRQVHIANV
jgi:glycosyltransferase involved in cell wall biosynthesis